MQAAGDVNITGSLDGGGVMNTAGGAAPGTITKSGGGTLYLSGAATYAVPLVVSGGTLNFSQATGVSANYSGVISGTRPVVKSAGGIVTLSGANTYTGETDVNAGTLLVNGSLRSSGLTVVNNGGTLGGTGTAGRVTVNAGGHLAPGNGAGKLSLLNSLILVSGAKLDIDLDTPSTSDEVLMTGYNLAVNGQQFSDFTFHATSNFGAGSYTLIDAFSASGSLGANKTGYINGFLATLSLVSGDLRLTVAVPEPAVWISLLMGAAGLLACARLRRK